MAAQLLCDEGLGIIIQKFQTAGSHQSGHSPGSFKGSKTQEAKTSGGKAETMNKENFVMICQMTNDQIVDHIAHEVEIDEKMLGSFSGRS